MAKQELARVTYELLNKLLEQHVSDYPKYANIMDVRTDYRTREIHITLAAPEATDRQEAANLVERRFDIGSLIQTMMEENHG
jgi:hypothetical protein